MLETIRLIIRDENVEDMVKVHEYDFNYLMGIEGVFEYKKRDPDEIRSWFPESDENLEKQEPLERAYYYNICLKDGMIPIGNLGFDRNDLSMKSVEISCYVHPDYWGCGYMMEAIIACMDNLFNNGFENIIYSYYEGNVNSKRLCEKIGFKPYKTEVSKNFLGHDSIVYCNIITKEEFKKIYGRRTR